MSCLALQPVTADDAGKYVVSVENIYGADHHFASVAVEGEWNGVLNALSNLSTNRIRITLSRERCISVKVLIR